MVWSQSHFVTMLDDAISNYRIGNFENTIRSFEPYQDLIVNDDGSFESLCDNDAYVSYIYNLIECWVDSHSRPQDYQDLTPATWIEVAESLRENIQNKSHPTDARWNLIFTKPCPKCKSPTNLVHGKIICSTCGAGSFFTNHD